MALDYESLRSVLSEFLMKITETADVDGRTATSVAPISRCIMECYSRECGEVESNKMTDEDLKREIDKLSKVLHIAK